MVCAAMKVFISYSSSDKHIREEISEYLEDLGHTVWADRVLKSGQEWWNEILQEVRQADVLITLISRDYNNSEACDLELRYATELNKYLLPIKVEPLSNELLPYDLGKLQVLDYHSLAPVKRITGLVNALNEIGSRPDFPRQNPSPLPQEPAIPISYKTRIYNRLELDDELDADSQKEIIAELRNAVMDNQSDHAEIKILLEKMLRRGDEIRLNISREIKDLLHKIEIQQQPKPSPSYVPPQPKMHPGMAQNAQFSAAMPHPVSEDGLNVGLQILAFLFPIAGIVMYFIYKDDAKAKAKRGLILAIIGMVTYFIIAGLDGGGDYAYYY